MKSDGGRPLVTINKRMLPLSSVTLYGDIHYKLHDSLRDVSRRRAGQEVPVNLVRKGEQLKVNIRICVLPIIM